MDTSHGIIYLTDKNGKQDKTRQIKRIRFNETKNIYLITFENSEKVFHYKPENVEIIRNALAAEKQTGTVFEYLKNIASLSDMRNDFDEKILVKNYERVRLVNPDSALAFYLNPNGKKIKWNGIVHPIFPFGCNNSQYKAVTNALENSFSIIQGPPGTGKTQTILNIIANLLVWNKTVLVVSNNNSAIENVYEKLSSPKYNLGFIVAPLGKSDNISEFLEKQAEEYPYEIKSWTIEQDEAQMFDSLTKSFETLKGLFEYQEKEATLKQELDELETEYRHFSLSNVSENLFASKPLSALSSEEIMSLWQSIQFEIDRKDSLGFLFKLKIFFKFHIGSYKFWKIESSKLIATVKELYYKNRIQELKNEILEKEELKKKFNAERLYASSLDYLRYKINKRYGKNEKRKVFTDKDLDKTESGFYQEYPIVLSTTFSSRNCLPYFSQDFLFDYLIMDEASQVDVSTGALALSCAKNVVIVGDKKQLPNVVTTTDKKKAEQIFSEYKINPAYDFSNHSFLSSIEELIPDVPQTLLREHYRCHPKIINFCNQKFYDNQLLIMTSDKNEKDVLKVYKTNVGNHCRGHENQRQVDVISKEILPSLANVTKDEIGIIAPYRGQTNLISKTIPDIQADTVHKFQGREKDVIIISTTDDEITDFADDENLLNVAVSRAKTNLCIVISGNEQPKDKNISDLISYIQYNNCEISESKVNSVFDYLYSQYTKKRFEYLSKIKKISKYDSENIMYKLICEILETEEFKNLGVIFEQPLKDIGNLNNLKNLNEEEKAYASKTWTHIDFLIYNKISKKPVLAIEVDGHKYHKKGTRQSERDTLKNRILEACNIPLLRLSTAGSGEREKILEKLKNIKLNSEEK
ncbi:AAA domain-containing protein [Treponema pedis]|uniref:AAA domain-containing protein n=1 Tax=Treponema pedis TaxID=409322 RepID=UPI00042450BD|nr:AAA domain-containing protein [Treponema pedis]